MVITLTMSRSLWLLWAGEDITRNIVFRNPRKIYQRGRYPRRFGMLLHCQYAR